MNYHFVGYFLGLVLFGLGALQLIPAALDYVWDSNNARSFVMGAFFSMFVGGALVFSNMGYDRHMSVRDGFVLASLSLVCMSLFAAFPIWLSDLNLSAVDAIFEATSGTTTTGASVIVNLGEASYGLLFWRSMLQWLGGFGFLMFATVLLPYLRVGGMQFFRTESTGQSSKILPRSQDVLGLMFAVYAALSILCGLLYWAMGMQGFDAINYAMTTVSSGGFATQNDSFYFYRGHYGLLYTAILFMILSALPYVLYVKWMTKGKSSFGTDEQFLAFMGILAICISLMALWLYHIQDQTTFYSILHAAFSVTSILTTTGFWMVDYSGWGLFAAFFFLFLTYVGACAGSTGGGLKIMRLLIVSKVMISHLQSLIYPSGRFVFRYQGQSIGQDVVMTVLGFLCLYVVTNTLLTIMLAMTGVELQTAMSAAASAIANVGPGIGDEIGPGGNYADFPDMAKIFLGMGMIVGRLEILTVFILFSSRFWRD